MSQQNDSPRRAEPRASRPYMPGYGIVEAESGRGLLPWNWATQRLVKARSYWVATTRPDGQPHAMAVWGIWLEDSFYFSTGRQSRKARNLAANPSCVICTEADDEAIVVEGVAEEVSDATLLRKFAELYGEKYQWNMEGFAEPVYVVRPSVAFGFIASGDEFSNSATRWLFEQG